MTKKALYCIKKSLFSSTQQTPVIVKHKPVFEFPYAIEFIKFGGIVYHRFISVIGHELYATTELLPTDVVFQNNEQVIVKVHRSNNRSFGMSTVTHTYMEDNMSTKIRHHPTSICHWFQPKKYFVGFNDFEIWSSAIYNLTRC